MEYCYWDVGAPQKWPAIVLESCFFSWTCPGSAVRGVFSSLQALKQNEKSMCVCVRVNYCMKTTVIKAHGLHTLFPLQAYRAKVCVFYAMQTACVEVPLLRWYCKLQHTSDDYAQTFLCYASLAGFDFSMRSSDVCLFPKQHKRRFDGDL